MQFANYSRIVFVIWKNWIFGGGRISAGSVSLGENFLWGIKFSGVFTRRGKNGISSNDLKKTEIK